MKHVNWVQQEQNIEYHVIQWKNSEFHTHHTRRDRDLAGGMGPFSVAKVIGGSAGGQIRTDSPGNDKVPQMEQNRTVDFGAAGLAGGVKQSDEVSISSESAHRQHMADDAGKPDVQQLAMTQQPCVTEQKQGALGDKASWMIEEQGIRNRLKDSARRLLEICQKQKQKLSEVLSEKEKPEDKEQRKTATRKASKEEMWSMQAENHYLLDSYDKNGNYSILGK